jgi:hypothetical protein
VDVGVIIYSTDPEEELLGLVRVWLITGPEPAVAPVIPPVIFPMVHAYADGTLDASEIFGLVPLHIASVAGLVTTGVGLTVTVIVNGAPGQPPATDVGVTIYSTVPAVVLPGLFNVWLITGPALATAPLMPPVMVPIVQI